MFEIKDIMQYVDHTILAPTAVWADVQKVCEESIMYKTASVCIAPSFVKMANDSFGDKLNICTVIGFPLGYSVLEAKIAETKQAILDGANEIDMVINIGDLKSGKINEVTNEIREIKKACNDKLLKVIIETCFLSEEDKINACKCVNDGGADFIKTSTGFGSGGADILDIELFKKHINENVKIKASGGIRTKEDMQKFIDAGVLRIGTSSAVKCI